MKRIVLFVVLCVAAVTASQAQQVLYSENFNGTAGSALPSGWATTVNSTLTWETWASNMLTMNFTNVPDPTGRALVVNRDFNTPIVAGVTTLVSSPQYNLAGQTSIIASFVRMMPGVGDTLLFQVSADNGATWNTVQNCTPLAFVNTPTTVYVDISAYAGQTIKIGLLYKQSTYPPIIGIDNFQIFTAPPNDIALISTRQTAGAPTSYGAPNTPVTIVGKVFNGGTNDITSYTVKYKQGNNPVVSYVVNNVYITPFGEGQFATDQPFTIPSVGNFPLKIWVELPGDGDHTNDTLNGLITGVANMPVKKIVFEEGTGTWCANCPRGSYAMDQFAHDFPGKVAQISIHNSLNSPADPMTITPYDTFLRQHEFPNVVIDRTSVKSMVTIANPSSVISSLEEVTMVYDSIKNYFGYADITLGTPNVATASVTVPVTVKPAVNLTGVRLAFVITESNVTGTGPGWEQKNAYSGDNVTNVGQSGWGAEPDPATDIKYHFVARSITPSPDGDAVAGWPATLAAGTSYTTSLNAPLNASWNKQNLQYIVMLISDDGKILNSNFTALPVLQDPFGNPTSSVAALEAGIEYTALYPNPPAGNIVYLQVKAKESMTAALQITDALGRTVTQNNRMEKLTAGDNKIEIATDGLANGIYTVSLSTSKGRVALKLQITK